MSPARPWIGLAAHFSSPAGLGFWGSGAGLEAHFGASGAGLEAHFWDSGACLEAHFWARVYARLRRFPAQAQAKGPGPWSVVLVPGPWHQRSLRGTGFSPLGSIWELWKHRDHHPTQNFDPRHFKQVPGPVEAALTSKIEKIIEGVEPKIKISQKF